jgi:type VI secretion system protein ImpK
MPIAPSARSVDPDTDPLGTQVWNRRSAPPKPAASADAGTAGPNLLMSEASTLLALVPQLRSTAQIADLAQLRARIVELLREFDEGLRRRGGGSGPAQKAHLVLCALIDEVVEAMPWGAGGQWERLNPWQAAGARPGAATVQQLAQMAEDRGANRDLRELIYVALALGFDARGRAAAGGAGDLEQIRSRVAALLKREADASAQPLSVRWRPAVGRANAVGSWLPLWVGTFVVAGLLAALYFSLSLALGSSSDRVFAQVASLRLPAPAATKAAPAQQQRLVPLLNAGDSQNLQVRDEVDRSVVTLRDDTLFEPATANLLPAGADALRPVAAALLRTPGRILVLGHTDSHSERSARFPSNWELSVERARAVHDALLLLGVPTARMRYDGHADTEPLTAGGADPAQVHSGRIEIVLQAGR